MSALHHLPVPSPTSTVVAPAKAKAPADPSPLHQCLSDNKTVPVLTSCNPKIRDPLHSQHCEECCLICPSFQRIIPLIEIHAPKLGHSLKLYVFILYHKHDNIINKCSQHTRYFPWPPLDDKSFQAIKTVTHILYHHQVGLGHLSVIRALIHGPPS